jgi:hypothetical protein
MCTSQLRKPEFDNGRIHLVQHSIGKGITLCEKEEQKTCVQYAREPSLRSRLGRVTTGQRYKKKEQTRNTVENLRATEERMCSTTE